MSEDTEDQKRDAELARIRKHVDEMGEHWENVQVFCSRFEGDDTQILHLGKGNLHARVGQVAAWVIREEEKEREEIRREMRNEP